MPLTKKQIGVLKGMIIGASLSISLVGLGSYLNPFDYSSTLSVIEKLQVAIIWGLIPTLFLAISIGRVAKHRFFSPEDIDGSALSTGTPQVLVLQSLLQNTFEQTLLAFLTYCAWAVIMPATCLSVIPLAALTFGLGRILFFTGYKNGAPARAIGFTLSFYPSLCMLFSLIGALAWQQIS